MTHWLDRITEPFAPRWTLRRARARIAGEMLVRSYDGASAGRRTQGWRRGTGDANAAVGSGIERLREVARDLVRNNSYAAAALNTIVDHVVGWGIVAQTPKGSWWQDWAETTACDADGRLDFAGIQKQVVRTMAEAGEVLVRRRWRRPIDNLPVPMQLQVIEPDLLDLSKEGRSDVGNIIIQGVEFNPIGQRVAYWLFSEHPGATGSFRTGAAASKPVPAAEVLHIFKPERPGQVRAPSWFAPVILRMKDFDDYEDAALMKQKVAACLAVITSDVDGTATPLGSTTTAEPLIDRLEPGIIANVTPGRSVTVVDPPSVSEHAAYSATILRAIASGIGIAYEDLTGDYCVAPETRVLRSDLRWVRADELKIGDEIVAFDENRPGKRQFRKHRKATVIRAGRRDLPRVSVKTDRAAITVSADHAFLCIRPQRGAGSQWRMHQWVRAADLEHGDAILFLCEPWHDGETYAHGYLKGISDGEGWVDRRRGSVGISQKSGRVYDEIGQALGQLGFSARQTSARPDTDVATWDLNRMTEALRFLGEVRPDRLLARARSVYEGKAVAGGKGKRSIYARVYSAQPDGVGPVVTLETTTHTVITEGLYSHNTNMPFSAARMSRIRSWARVEDWRWRLLVPQLCMPVWAWALEAAAVAGKTALAAPEWTAPAMPAVDPQSEALAYQTLLRIGAMSWPEMIRERGMDPASVLKEIAASNKALDAAGVILDADPRKTTQAGNPRDPAPAKPAEPVAAPVAGPNGNGSRNGHVEDRAASAADHLALKRDVAELRALVIRQAMAEPVAPENHVHITTPPAPPAPGVTIAEGAIRAEVHAAPAPEVTVDARTTIERGAIEVPVTVEAPPPATVDARTTIAEGAIQVSAPTTIQQAPAPPTVTVVRTSARPAEAPGPIAATDAE